MTAFPVGFLVVSYYQTSTLYLQLVNPDSTGNDLPYTVSTPESKGSGCWFPSWSLSSDESNGSEVAFVKSVKDNNQQIFIGNEQFTDKTGDKITFAWKPGKRKIAFVQQSGSDHKIWFAYKNGSQTETELHSSDYLPFVEDIRQLSWHSNHIAVASSKGIYIYTLDSNDKLVDRKRISDTPAHSVAWSPDGTHLAFASKEKGIYTLKPDGKDRKRLSTTSSEAVVWSPDGDYLTANGSPGLWVIEMANGTIHIIEEIEEVEKGNLNHLSLSWVPEKFSPSDWTGCEEN
jgi:Tol biopolymer transport system component